MFSTKESSALNKKAAQINDGIKLANTGFQQPAIVNTETGQEMSEEELMMYASHSPIFTEATSAVAIANFNRLMQGQQKEAVAAMGEATSEENEDGKMLDMYGEEMQPNPSAAKHTNYSESELVEMVGENVVHSKASSYSVNQSAKNVYSIEEFQNYLAAQGSEVSEKLEQVETESEE